MTLCIECEGSGVCEHKRVRSARFRDYYGIALATIQRQFMGIRLSFIQDATKAGVTASGPGIVVAILLSIHLDFLQKRVPKEGPPSSFEQTRTRYWY